MNGKPKKFPKKKIIVHAYGNNSKMGLSIIITCYHAKYLYWNNQLYSKYDHAVKK